MPKKKTNTNTSEAKLTFIPGNAIPDLEEALANSGQKTWKASAEEQKDLLWCMNRIDNQMRPAQSQYHTEWDNARNIHECTIVPDPMRESFKVPISAAMIEAGIAEEIDAFPDFAVDTQEPDDRQKLPMLNAAKKHALWRTNYDKVKYEALRIRRIYGFCAIRIYFRRETRIIQQRVPVIGDEGVQLGYEDAVDFPYDDVWIEVIDNPRRFLIGEGDKDIDTAIDCALVTEVDWDGFKPMVEHDRRFKNVEFVKPGWEYKIDLNIQGEYDGIGCQQISSDRNSKVTIIEYWNKNRDKYFMIANGVLIRQTCLVDDHKELPFAVLHMYRRPHTFYSKGVPKLIESIEAAYNAIVQAEVRATKLAFPILLTDDDSAVDPRQIAPYPGVVLEGGLDRIELKPLGSVPNEVYRLKDKLEEWLIWLTGINIKQIFSAEGGTNQRVGIEALKKESMLSRINANLRENEAGFVVRMGELLMQDIMQYYPVPKIRRLLPEDDLGAIPESRKVYEGKKVIGILEDRKIPVDGMVLKETANEEKGLFELKNMGGKGGSYILARPEYIRVKSKLDIRAVRPSAMGSSKEAKKLTMLELSDHAIMVNQAAMQMGAEPPTMGPNGEEIPGKPGAPIWNLEYIERQLAEAHELPPEKALNVADADDEQSFEDELDELTKPLVEMLKKAPPPRPSTAPVGIEQSMQPLSSVKQGMTPEQQSEFQQLSL